ncbi:LamG domain-containing protein [Aliiglaciecola lipolytica]|uniref:LamG domain-containing protein n=1 Tax=Aliiglaciecola lipolytica TaxID=477689 RepID=UPI001C07F799|nr:LamG domain-containing protein [Aliiglaciecola lipolytica]MBU2877927.1 LamG domain-containing protein [Aliiglaciecola lipolytica]
MKIRNICRSAVILGLMSCNAYAETKAAWMQGNWGISYRIPGGDVAYSGSHVAEYNVDAAVEQISAIPGLKWVQLNLTNGASGDRFIVPVSEVEAINPLSAPNSYNDLYDPTIPGQDLFDQLALAFKAKGIKVIAYIATQGPGMLKHGAQNSMDLDKSIPNCKSSKPLITDPNTQVYCSANMNRWRDYVLEQYPSSSLYRSFELSMVNIVETLSLRYGNTIDGWWFDHSGFGDSTLLHAAALAGNSDAVVTFNEGDKVPLVNNPDTLDDYTFGHPTPIGSEVSSDDKNLPMLTSIEATSDGVFPGTGNDVGSVGHMFMPLQESWNGGTVVFSEAKGSDWLNRALKAGGAYTWALSQDSNDALGGGGARIISEPQVKMLERMNFNIGKQLHMNLDGADGTTAYDDSVNQYTASVSGASFVNDATRGKVASFTEGDQLELDSYAGILGHNARTTMAWIKTSDSKGDIIDWGNNTTGERWWLRVVDGKFKLILKGSNVSGTTVLNDGQWHHIAVVAPDNIVENIRVYIDGVLENVAVNDNASATFNTTSGGNVEIGGAYTGLIDKVVVHDRALAENEIAYVVNSANADLDLEVALDVRFEDSANSTRVTDSSVYNRSGINRGAISGIYDAFRDSQVYSFSGVDSGVDVDDLYDSDYAHEVVMTTDNSKNSKGYSGVNGGEPRTVMAWIKTTFGGAVIAQWGNKNSVDGEQYEVRLKNGALRLDITGGIVKGTTQINDGEWHHIAVVSSDEHLANTKLYVDGVLETSTVLGSQKTIDTTTLNGDSRDVIIGSTFVGEMDDFIIHQRALRQFEIKNAAGL